MNVGYATECGDKMSVYRERESERDDNESDDGIRMLWEQKTVLIPFPSTDVLRSLLSSDPQD